MPPVAERHVSHCFCGCKIGVGEESSKIQIWPAENLEPSLLFLKRKCLQLLSCPLKVTLTSLQAVQLRVLCLGLDTPQSLWVIKPLLVFFSLPNCYSTVLCPLAEWGIFYFKWTQWRPEQAMFKPLVMSSENTGIDFLNKTLMEKVQWSLSWIPL